MNLLNYNKIHSPVMLKEVIDNLIKKANGIYIDNTFGTGGHSKVILEKLKNGKLIAFEWDEEEIELVKNDNFFSLNTNFELINDNFTNLVDHLKRLNIKKVDGFLFDLGLSSYQISEESKGFSYRINAPLDMRINSKNKVSTEYVINNYSTKKLADIFYHFGGERRSRLIAKKITFWRQKVKITTTQQLVGIIASCFPIKKKQHPARRTFQALRIYVNNELENLTQALECSFKYLNLEGRIVVISYHSLEDRIVKHMFKKYNLSGNYKIITKKPLIPSRKEIEINHRARSAKMRVITRIL